MVRLFDPVGAVAAGGEQASDSVVGEVAEAAGDSAGGFDDAIDRLCRCWGYADVQVTGPFMAAFWRCLVGIVKP
jgi:hypothetical protein